MTDYDLGTAHGSIEIDAQIDSLRKTIAELEALKATVSGVESPLHKLDAVLDKVEKTTRSLGSAVQGLDIDLARVAKTSATVYKAVDSVRNPMRLMVGSLRGMSLGILGVNREMNNFPSWTRSVMRASTAITAVGIGAVVMRRGIVSAGTALYQMASQNHLLFNAMGNAELKMRQLYNSTGKLGQGLRAAAENVKGADRGIRGFYNALDKGTSGVAKAIVGAALLASGLRKLAGYAAILPKLGMAFAAVTLGAAALGPLASVVLGLADALKTLSGAALMLPGILVTLGMAGAVVAIGMKSLSAAFKAGMGDAEGFEEAIKNLSPTMQGVARTVQGFKAEFKDLKNDLGDTMFAGLEQDLKSLGGGYLPTLRTGALGVAAGVNLMKDNLVDFLGKGDTIADTGRLLRSTEVIVHNFAGALYPILTVFKDLAVVGADVFRDLTTGVGASATSLSMFIAEARKTGELKEWMEDGIQGFRDLGSAIGSTYRGIKEFLHAVGGDGGNSLERLADGAERFETWMSKSAVNGNVSIVIDKLQQMGSTSFDLIQQSLSEVFGFLKSISGFMESFSTGFTSGLQTAIGVIGGVATALGTVMSAMGPFGEILGTIMAVAAAFKILLMIVGPVIAVLKVLGGMAMLFSGLSAALVGVAASMAKVSHAGGAMAGIAANASRAAYGLAGMLSGPLMAGIAAVMVGFMAWSAQSNAVEASNEAIADSAQHSAEAYRELTDAFKESEGAVDSTVIDQISQSLGTLRDDLEKTADADTSFFADVGANIQDMFKSSTYSWDGMFGGGEQKEANEEIDKTAEKAAKAAKSMDELGWSNERMAEAIAGTDGQFQSLIANLAATESGGEEAIAKLNGQRQAFLEIQGAMDSVGPSAIQLSNAVGVIADEASSAAEKTDALRSALESMGLLQVSEVEAFTKLQDDIESLSEAMVEPLGSAELLGDALINGATGGLNATNTAAQELWRRLQPLSESLTNAASAGGNVDEAMAKIVPELNKVRESAGLMEGQVVDADAKWAKLLATMGFAPEEIKTLVSLTGTDAAQQELFVLENALRGLPLNTPVNVFMSDETILTKIEDLGATVNRLPAGEVEITVPNESVKRSILALGEYVTLNPITGKMEIKADEAQIAAEKARVDELMKKPVQVPFTYKGPDGKDVHATFGTTNRVDLADPKTPEGAPAPAAEIAPGVPAPPTETKTKVTVEGAEAAETKVNRIAQLLGAIKDKKINFEITGIDAALGALNSINIGLENVKSSRKNFSIDGIVQALGALNSINVGLANIPEMTVKHFMIEGTDPAIGAIIAVKAELDNLNPTIDSLRANIAGFASAVQQALAEATGAIAVFAANALVPLNNAATQARTSGAALGQGFADGISSKAQAVQDAAMRLAQSASRPLPRSPAEIGPFSGRGWTPFRGQALAEGFAQGIDQGSATAQKSSLSMAQAVADAMDSVRASFNMPTTGFAANDMSASKKYIRDISVTDEELAQKRAEKAQAAADKAVLEGEKAAANIPAQEEKIAKARESVAEAQKRVDESKTAKSRVNAEESLAKARERQADAEAKLGELQSSARNTDPLTNANSTSGTAASGNEIDAFVTSLDSAQYGMGAFNQAMMDCSAFVSSVANVATGRDPFSERGTTTNMGQFLSERGFVEGAGGPGDLSVGWWDRGGGQNGHTAITTGSGLNAESTTGGVRFGEGAAGARSNNSQFDRFMHLPGGGGGNPISVTDSGVTAAANASGETEEQALARLISQDEKLGESLAIAKDPRSSNEQIIQALQGIDRGMANLNETDKKTLEGQKSAVMEDRGIKEYDPFEGAIEQGKELEFAIGAAQTALGLFTTIESGVANASNVGKMMVRGLSNTSDVHSLVDGVQGMASTVAEVVSAVGSIVDIVASVAATAGSAIPGIGQVASVISGITGGIANVNAIVDLVQEVSHIGGRIGGGILSALAGGGNGPLQGNVKTLLDTNDNTIKTWSDRNAAEKTVHGSPLFGSDPRDPSKAGGFRDLNIYQGPGGDPAEMMNQAMFAVKAHSSGVFSG